MSLLSLLLPVGGVLAIVLVCWLAGGTGKAIIADAEAARACLRHDEPGFAPARVLLARDRRVALVADDRGTDIAAVMAFGDKLVSRRFARGAIRSASLREQPGTGRVLTLLTDDHTCRRIDLPLDPGPGPAPGADTPASHQSPESIDSIDLWLAALARLMPPSAHPASAAIENA
ncbi:MAG TPA: hypothetical protein VNM90_01200 [Haliangium sp.]|nr:hypothetical protein [Haliangium sp.]